jgi:hypothetical protein
MHLALALAPAWPHRVDGGVLLLVAALFLATILAHRYWRAVIRLEDELQARRVDAERSLERYRVAFRAMAEPAAFVDRATALVVEATPGWVAAGLPPVGDTLHGPDEALATAWRALAPPDADHRPAAPVVLAIALRPFRAEPLGGASLGLVLVVAQ